ncbi:MAG: hypothetical protein ACLPYS_20015 [Vulcanimicrobiaceae bacterium]
MTVAGKDAARSPYDAAIATATEKEKARLQKLRLEFDIPSDSPEWLFYAILAPLLDQGALIDAVVSAVKARLPRPAPFSVGGLLSPWQQVVALFLGVLLAAGIAWWFRGMLPHHVAAIVQLAMAMTFGGLLVLVYYEAGARWRR